jgi:hypothetical protein
MHAAQPQPAPAQAHEPGATAQPTPRSDSQSAAPTPRPQPATYTWQITGAPTSAAGLFFLLNAMRWLQLPEALAAGLSETSPHFIAHVLHHLADHVQLDPGDPIRLWLASITITPPSQTALVCDLAWLPPNLPLRRIDSERALVRAWSLAIRRWCWRLAFIPAREIILRPGLFSLSRTDLDITLSLDAADIRIRRAGLDLDPGWLPWFGLVVRFHYRFHGEFDA